MTDCHGRRSNIEIWEGEGALKSESILGGGGHNTLFLTNSL